MDYERASGNTLEEMREKARSSPLYQRGDMTLVWVNEGDLDLTSSQSKDAEIAQIADYLTNQDDEPYAGFGDTDRLHYWRDKAITAANRLRALKETTDALRD